MQPTIDPRFMDVLLAVGISGRDRGYSTQGDVLVKTSADGVDLNKIWDQLAEVLNIWNNERSSLIKLLSYPTTNVADAIPQGISSDSFELASEFGVPQAAREPATALPLGYDFTDYDKRSAFTWKFLRDSTAEQIRATANRILEADNKLVNGTILKRLFTPTEGLNEHGHRVFGLWTGSDGIVPPPYMGQTFDSSHTHYFTSGATQIDSQDIEVSIHHVQEHGYGVAQGSQLLILANPTDGEFIETWRAGEESRAGGPKAKHDFVRSGTAPAYLTEDHRRRTGSRQLPQSAGQRLLRSGLAHPAPVRAERICGGGCEWRPRQPVQPRRCPPASEPGLPGLAGDPGPRPLPSAGFVLLPRIRGGRSASQRGSLHPGHCLRQLHGSDDHRGLGPMATVPNREPGESEFCHGPGLEQEQHVGLSPAHGGRYRGTTPPVDRYGHEQTT